MKKRYTVKETDRITRELKAIMIEHVKENYKEIVEEYELVLGLMVFPKGYTGVDRKGQYI